MSETTGTPTGNTFTWIGPASGNWNQASNWDDTTTGTNPAVVAPGTLDSVVFNSPTDLYQVISGVGDAASLTLNGDNVVAGQLNVGTVTNTGMLDITAGASLLAGTATLGYYDNVTGAGALLDVSGTLSVASFASLTVSNGAAVETDTLVLAGSDNVILDATAAIEVGTAGSATAGALTIDSGATLAVTGHDASIYGLLDGGDPALTTLNVIDNGLLSISTAGSLYGETASLNISGTLSGSGRVAIGAGAELMVSTVAAGSLTLSLGANASLNLDAVGAGNTISFAGAGGALTLNAVTSDGSTASFQDAATITGFNDTDAILLLGGTVTSVVYTAGSASGTGILTLFDGTTSVGTLSLAGTYSSDTFLDLPVSAIESEIVLAAPAVSGPSAGTATGNTFTWIGPASGNWNQASNWDDTTTGTNPAVVAPGTLDSVVFNSPTDLYQVISGVGDAASLTLNGDNVVAGQLNVGTVTNTGMLDITAGASLLAGTATLGYYDNVTGAGALLDVSGTLSVASFASLTVSNGAAVETDTLVLAGSDNVILDATAAIEVGTAGSATAGALTIDSGATLAVTGHGASIYGLLDGGDPALTTLNVIDNGLLSISTAGSLYGETASLNISGTLSGSGRVAIGAGAELMVSTVAAGSLTLSLGANASLNLDAVGAGNTISFAGAGGALTLNAVTSDGSTASFQDAATITGFNDTDAILLLGGTVTSVVYTAGSASGTGILTLFDGTTSVGTLSLAGTYSSDTFLDLPVSAIESEIVLAAPAVSGPSAGTATGNTFTWIGPASGNWNQASNWDDTTTGTNPAVVAPGTLDSVVFNSPTDLYQVISGVGDAASLTLNGDNVVAGQLNVGTVTNTGMLDITAGASLLAGTATLGYYDNVTGAGALLDVSGTLSVASFASLTVSNGAAVETDTLVLAGSDNVILDATAAIEVGTAGSATAGALTIDSGATLAVTGHDASIYGLLDGGDPALTTLNVIDNGLLSISTAGSLYGETASLNISGTLSGSGRVAIGAGAELMVSTVAAGSLTLSLGANASLNLDAVGAGNTISFAGAGGALTLNAVTNDGSTASFQDAATITGFNDTDAILLLGGTVTSVVYTAGSASGTGILTLFDGTTSVGTLSLAGTYSSDTFLVTPVNAGENQISLFLGGVFVQGDTVTVTPNAGQVVSLNQLVDDPNLFPTGTIASLILDGPGTADVSGTITINDLEVPDGGQLILNGAAVVTDPVSVDANGDIIGYGTLIGDLTNTGLITASGGSLLLTGNITGDGALDIAAGATLELQGSVAAGEIVSFSASGTGTLLIDDPATFDATITNFVAGDTIVVETPSAATFSQTGSVVSVIENGTTLGTLNFGSAAQAQSAFTTTGALGDHALCFVAGTLLQVPSGQKPVEDLKVGDLVITASGQARPIRWIGVGRVLATRGRRSAATPVIVRKGAIGPNVPHQDLHVTKGHALYLDGVLIPVEFLVNHRSILWDDRAQEVKIYHVELDSHDVLLANGALAESYRDDGNRWLFQNANAGWHLPPQDPYAPVLTGGPVVDVVWRRLLDRAGPRDLPPLTDDPDLHLLVDGARVDAKEHQGPVYIFRLPPSPKSVVIASREAVPAEFGIARDPRSLGVALRRVVVRQGAKFMLFEADDERLAAGFHAYEADCQLRWTDGRAELPAADFARFDKGAEVMLHLGGTTQYPEDGADAARVAA